MNTTATAHEYRFLVDSDPVDLNAVDFHLVRYAAAGQIHFHRRRNTDRVCGTSACVLHSSPHSVCERLEFYLLCDRPANARCTRMQASEKVHSTADLGDRKSFKRTVR